MGKDITSCHLEWGRFFALSLSGVMALYFYVPKWIILFHIFILLGLLLFWIPLYKYMLFFWSLLGRLLYINRKNDIA